ncbi:MAG: YraN family protein [Methylophilaceae bacterium]|nr:YraN family protein [Methylophilaceae bacterium]
MNNLGGHAEKNAENYLIIQGLSLLKQNYSCKYGEIDLIMRDGNTTVFEELRLRSNSAFGSAGSNITKSKQSKFSRTAEHYLQQNGNVGCKFDAVLMSKADATSIERIKNAFDS